MLVMFMQNLELSVARCPACIEKKADKGAQWRLERAYEENPLSDANGLGVDFAGTAAATEKVGG